MAKGKRKLDAKSFAQQKRHRRQWVTFIRMCRYGVNNFSRNAWLTIAATAVMTITLFIIFLSVVIQNVVQDTGNQISDNVDMSIYLETDTPEDTVNKIADQVRELSSVTTVAIETPAQAREKQARLYSNNADALTAIKESNNRHDWSLKVKVVDINDVSQLREFVATNELYEEHSSRAPSFAGERKQAIENIGRIVDFARQVGIGASLVFVVISTLIIFNTIRMAIFNRREEIQMMKLIGAERSFIRGPFIVEAIVYGFFGAIVATGLGFGTLVVAAPPLLGYGINIGPTFDAAIMFAPFIILGMIVIGAIIGIFSSLLATQRYLKL